MSRPTKAGWYPKNFLGVMKQVYVFRRCGELQYTEEHFPVKETADYQWGRRIEREKRRKK